MEIFLPGSTVSIQALHLARNRSAHAPIKVLSMLEKKAFLVSIKLPEPKGPDGFGIWLNFSVKEPVDLCALAI